MVMISHQKNHLHGQIKAKKYLLQLIFSPDHCPETTLAWITHLGNFEASAAVGFGLVEASELITCSLRWRLDCIVLLSTLTTSRLCKKSASLLDLQGRGLTTIPSFSPSLSSLDINSATTHLFHLSFTS